MRAVALHECPETCREQNSDKQIPKAVSDNLTIGISESNCVNDLNSVAAHEFTVVGTIDERQTIYFRMIQISMFFEMKFFREDSLTDCIAVQSQYLEMVVREWISMIDGKIDHETAYD